MPTYEDDLQNTQIALEDKGFTIDIIEYIRGAYHAQCQEPFDTKEEIHEGGYQSHEEEKEFTHDSTEDNEDLVEERESEDINTSSS